jgi:hypothetical protein
MFSHLTIRCPPYLPEGWEALSDDRAKNLVTGEQRDVWDIEGASLGKPVSNYAHEPSRRRAGITCNQGMRWNPYHAAYPPQYEMGMANLVVEQNHHGYHHQHLGMSQPFVSGSQLGAPAPYMGLGTQNAPIDVDADPASLWHAAPGYAHDPTMSQEDYNALFDFLQQPVQGKNTSPGAAPMGPTFPPVEGFNNLPGPASMASLFPPFHGYYNLPDPPVAPPFPPFQGHNTLPGPAPMAPPFPGFPIVTPPTTLSPSPFPPVQGIANLPGPGPEQLAPGDSFFDLVSLDLDMSFLTKDPFGMDNPPSWEELFPDWIEPSAFIES